MVNSVHVSTVFYGGEVAVVLHRLGQVLSVCGVNVLYRMNRDDLFVVVLSFNVTKFVYIHFNPPANKRGIINLYMLYIYKYPMLFVCVVYKIMFV